MNWNWTEIKGFFNAFVDKFYRDETTTMAASLSFYTALSLAPTLIIFIAVTSLLSVDLQQNLLNEATNLVGHDAAVTLKMIMDSGQNSDLSTSAGLFGFLTILVSASFIFGELRFALNQIFAGEPDLAPSLTFWHAVWNFVSERFIHIVLALSFIFLLATSLMVSSFISSPFFENKTWLHVASNIGISFILYSFFFAFMFRYVPQERSSWGQSFRGGLLTSALFVIGKESIAIYLGNNALGSAYGAAGSLVVFMAWIYYSALITLCGAQLSYLAMNYQRDKIVELPRTFSSNAKVLRRPTPHLGK